MHEEIVSSYTCSKDFHTIVANDIELYIESHFYFLMLWYACSAKYIERISKKLLEKKNTYIFFNTSTHKVYMYMRRVHICTYVQKIQKTVLLTWSRYVSIAFARFYTSPKVIRFIGFITCRATSIIRVYILKCARYGRVLSMSRIVAHSIFVHIVEYVCESKQKASVNKHENTK